MVWGLGVAISKVSLLPYYLALTFSEKYSKYPKISYTKIFDKTAIANRADPDQTAPSGAV